MTQEPTIGLFLEYVGCLHMHCVVVVVSSLAGAVLSMRVVVYGRCCLYGII